MVSPYGPNSSIEKDSVEKASNDILSTIVIPKVVDSALVAAAPMSSRFFRSMTWVSVSSVNFPCSCSVPSLYERHH